MKSAAFAAHDLRVGDTVSYMFDDVLRVKEVKRMDLDTDLFLLLNTLPLYSVAIHEISEEIKYEVSLVEITRKPKCYITILNKLRSLPSAVLKLFKTSTR